MNIIKFTKVALMDYKRVGTIVPSSRYVSSRIGKYAAGKDFVVEYGAGTGVISREILNSISEKGRVVAFETNGELFKELQKIKDDRLQSVNDDVRGVGNYLKEKADVVVSGIPFSLMKCEDREEIIKNTREFIKEEGSFVVYQTSLLVLPLLKNYFKDVEIGFEPRNLPPYFIMVAKK